MKITVLGCGSSGGVPLIGNNWGACNPANPRNRRTRVSVLVEWKDTKVLIDTSPDIRQQFLDCGAGKIDGVLYTHAHADHCHGISELRSVMWLMGKPVDIYADVETMEELKQSFGYLFPGKKDSVYYKPVVTPHEISSAFSIGALNVVPFYQDHGYGRTLGFRFGDFAYSTDVHSLDETAFEALRGVKNWVVDCVRVTPPHPTHSHLEQTLQWINRVKPQHAWLTHMNHTMDYDQVAAILPEGVEPAYDGLVIEC